MNNYKNLVVWQKAMDLVLEVYRISKSFPSSERYSLTDQLRRAVVSIPSNIAEGCSRRTGKEFAQFLYVARGSNAEVETQLEIACRLGYLQYSDAQIAFDLCAEIGKMSAKLIDATEDKQ